MPRRCSVCQHPERHVVDVSLVQRDSYRTIADSFGLSESALKRHVKDHLPELLVKSSAAVEASDADALVAELRRVADNLERLSEKAEKDEDYRTAIAGNVALLKRAELLGKVRQLINEAPTLELHMHPEWVQLQALIVNAVRPYPEAREAVAKALAERSSSNGNR